ncbi:MAG: hypothetical protein IKR93_07135 [Firmicutes bacterium]|nr:hypothetical protein [Bacillota bacterium]
MTEESFRFKHSLIIEHYQYIELWLKYIYDFLYDDPSFKGLYDVSKHNIARLVQDIKALEVERNKQIISDELYERIKIATDSRNYWCHEFFVNEAIKNGVPRNELVRKRLINDLLFAETLRDDLFNLQYELRS